MAITPSGITIGPLPVVFADHGAVSPAADVHGGASSWWNAASDALDHDDCDNSGGNCSMANADGCFAVAIRDRLAAVHSECDCVHMPCAAMVHVTLVAVDTGW